MNRRILIGGAIVGLLIVAGLVYYLAAYVPAGELASADPSAPPEATVRPRVGPTAPRARPVDGVDRSNDNTRTKAS